MDQSTVPPLDSRADRHRRRGGFSPPGRRPGRGADRRAIEVLDTKRVVELA